MSITLCFATEQDDNSGSRWESEVWMPTWPPIVHIDLNHCHSALGSYLCVCLWVIERALQPPRACLSASVRCPSSIPLPGWLGCYLMKKDLVGDERLWLQSETDVSTFCQHSEVTTSQGSSLVTTECWWLQSQGPSFLTSDLLFYNKDWTMWCYCFILPGRGQVELCPVSAGRVTEWWRVESGLKQQLYSCLIMILFVLCLAHTPSSGPAVETSSADVRLENREGHSLLVAFRIRTTLDMWYFFNCFFLHLTNYYHTNW